MLFLLLFAVAVQALVWGRAPSAGSGGALVPGLRSAFGTPYAAAMVAAELAFCLWFRLRDTAVWVVLGGAGVDVVFWIAHVAGARFALDGAASMTAAFGAVALAASVWWQRATSRPR